MTINRQNFPNPPLEGIIVPVITPVNGDGKVDEAAFRAVLGRCIEGGVHGLFVGGTSGIGPLLPDQQWRRMLEIALDQVKGQRPLLAGVMETSTPRAIERIRHLEGLGFKYFVLTPTFYVPIRQHDEFMAHFGACRQATGMEMVVYNIPPCTGSTIPAETVLEMARRGWTRTCKDSSNDAAFFADLCRRGKEHGLGVFQGNYPHFTTLLELRAAGVVPVPGNIDPRPLADAWNALRAGDIETLQRLQPRIDALWQAMVSGFDFLSGNIYALQLLGIGSGEVIAPLQPASEERRKAIEAYLKREE